MLDFDFNWVLVPVTIVFFFIWLLDKLVFKQYRQRKEKTVAMQTAQQQVEQAQQRFDAIKAKYPTYDLQDHVSHVGEPEEVTQARDALSRQKVESVRLQHELNQHKINPVINWAYDFWPVLAVVLVVRSFLYEPYTIPSESMLPTLQVGDYILVNKFAYGVRLPLINKKVINVGEPEHGDVVVFRYPNNPSITYIKRIIGLPGDHIQFKKGELYVNNQKVAYTLGDQFVLPFKISQTQTINVTAQHWNVTYGQHHFQNQYVLPEQTDNMASELVYSLINNYEQPSNVLGLSGAFSGLSMGQDWSVTVPEGSYFAMGDNRDQSADSRYWGFVPEENLTGKATYIWVHKNPGWHIPSFARNGLIP